MKERVEAFTDSNASNKQEIANRIFDLVLNMNSTSKNNNGVGALSTGAAFDLLGGQHYF